MTQKLPSRRQLGMTLSYDSGDLFVNFFRYSSSLLCASNEGLLEDCSGNREPYMLRDEQQMIVDEWMAHFDDYLEANGWATWAEVNEGETA